MRLRVPIPVIKTSCATYLRGGQPAAQRALQNLHDHDIVPLTRRKTAILHDRVPGRKPLPRKEIITRLLRGVCELCGIYGDVHVHHVAKLAELASPGLDQPEWARLMATRRRKTLVVCPPCHDLIHNNPAQATPLTT